MADNIHKEIDNLYFFTATYPYGFGEGFIDNELPILSKRIKKISIFPLSKEGQPRRLPANASIGSIGLDTSDSISKSLWLKNIFWIIKVLAIEFFSCSSKLFFIKNFKLWNVLLVKGLENFELIKSSLKNDDNPVFYSFWLNRWALALAIAVDRKVIKDFIIRSNGFDIYDERWDGNYLPFRKYIYSKAKEIHINTGKGVEYIKAKNIYPEKIFLSYLGTQDHGMGKFEPTDEFTLLSCSSIIPLKRVHLIAEILKNCTSEISWVHIGEGAASEKLKEYVEVLPLNINFQLKKRFDTHDDLMDYLKDIHVNLFINVSETEGLPVTIQEALSFGIPIIATDVGGTSEVVNEQTGILINKEFEPQIIAERIEEFKSSSKNTISFRRGVRKFWEENFKMEHTASQFFSHLN